MVGAFLLILRIPVERARTAWLVRVAEFGDFLNVISIHIAQHLIPAILRFPPLIESIHHVEKCVFLIKSRVDEEDVGYRTVKEKSQEERK